MESSLVDALVTGGPVAILAGIIFVMYVRSVNKARDDRKFTEDRLTKLLEEDQRTRECHTRALTELTTLLMRLNGK